MSQLRQQSLHEDDDENYDLIKVDDSYTAGNDGGYKIVDILEESTEGEDMICSKNKHRSSQNSFKNHA